MELSGSEIYATGLQTVAKRVDGARLYQLDARLLPFEEEFDLVGAFDVIEHVDEDEVVMAEMHRAVRPGGGIMISVPQHRFLWSQRDVALRHKRRYARVDLLAKVRRAGFEPLRVTSFISLPFPLMALSALRNRRARADFDPFADLKISRTANAILSRVLAVERRLIERGVDFPFGGSLFLCARKVSHDGTSGGAD
jgi:SAM-dependent methyltransferase